MTKWRVAVEALPAGQFGRDVPERAVGHAYNLEAQEAAHPITQGTYSVKEDHEWATTFLGWDRCPECEKAVGRYPKG
ncbi:hypothetical protein GCM10023100_53670 [Actinocorallia cavernae]|uniref:Uncharacterized protein n=2 Tax=Actinomycetes TaxID=1760 RepID=A0ABP8SYN8_9ACTN